MSATVIPQKAVLDRFADGGPLLVQAASNLTPEQCRDHPIPGTWSIAELVSHLLDCDMVFADRMKRIIAEESPRWSPSTSKPGSSVYSPTRWTCWKPQPFSRPIADG